MEASHHIVEQLSQAEEAVLHIFLCREPAEEVRQMVCLTRLHQWVLRIRLCSIFVRCLVLLKLLIRRMLLISVSQELIERLYIIQKLLNPIHFHQLVAFLELLREDVNKSLKD
jgi:hypothetical protein